MTTHAPVIPSSDHPAILEGSWKSQPEPCSDGVVVLGGSGFVGAAIIEALRSAGIVRVTSAQRHAARAAQGVRQVRWDATRNSDLRPFLQGSGCVVNAVSGDRRTMLAATHAIAATAPAIDRIVHVSSIAVYGDTTGYVRETTPQRACSRYAAAKIACESALSGTGATILRPGIVYGPGSTQWVGRIGRLLRARRLGDLGKHGDGRCNLVHARDLGEAVVAALRTPAARGQTLNIGMTGPPRWNDYVVGLGRAIGAVPVRRIPAWRLSLETRLFAAPLIFARNHLAGSPDDLPEALSPALRRVFAQDIVLDCTVSDHLLPVPHTRVADGIAESAAWFLERYGLAQP